MKNLYIALGFFVAAHAWAQNAATETADKLFARFEYVDAAKEYLKVAKKGKDPYVYRQLADSYYNVYNSKDAIIWYAKAVETKQEAEIYYKYAQMLKAEGKFEEANTQMAKFAALAPKDQRAVAFKQDPNYLPKLRSQTKLFDEQILDINDKKYGDFGAFVLNDNSFYFASSRNTSRKTYGRDEQPFMDIYTATYSDNGSISEPKPLTDLNTKYHDGPLAITPDGNTMYFASESFREGDSEKAKVGQKNSLIYLYKATKENGKWGNVVALPFNNVKWSTGNPSISKDGKTLYFASNRKGSMGAGTDIWKVEVKGGNSYGEPVNLGKKVNTEGNENYPYIADDNKLYFASDGRKGFGALDIFYIDLAHDGEAVNVGLPVNSEKDDFAFTFNSAKNIGFFASNKAGKDNMYKAIPVCGVEAVVTVTDAATGKTLANAKVAILDDKNNVIETKITNAAGELTYSVDCDKAFVLQASATGYENGSFALPKTRGGTVPIPAALKPLADIIVDGKIALKNIYFDFDKSNITQEAAFELDKLVQTMTLYPNMVISIKTHSDNRGSDEYNLKLSDERARSTVQYVLSKGIAQERISGKGYGESEPLIKCDNCTDEQHALNRRVDFIIVKK